MANYKPSGLALESEGLPLEGIRVLDLTRNIAGPMATMVLADLGADVIKIESKGDGDDARGWGPPFIEEMSGMFWSVNRNKRSLVLDLADPESRWVMEALVDSSAVVVESFRWGSLDRLGYGYEWARERNPGLVYASVTAYGAGGPLREQPGYDPLMQAFGGIMDVTGEPDGKPVRVGVSIIDVGTGVWTATAILAALFEGRVSGRGKHITTALFETSLSWMSPHIINHWIGGPPAQRFGSGSAVIVPYQAFEADGGHAVIAAGNDRIFRALAAALGHDEWATDPRFLTNALRVGHRDLLVDLIEAVTRTIPLGSLLERLIEAGVPCAKIRNVAEIAGDEQANASGIFQTVQGGGSRQWSVGLPFQLDGQRPPLRREPPRLGEHTQEILAELGAATVIAEVRGK